MELGLEVEDSGHEEGRDVQHSVEIYDSTQTQSQKKERGKKRNRKNKTSLKMSRDSSLVQMTARQSVQR